MTAETRPAVQAFVRQEPAPVLPPPADTRGALAFLRDRLFGGLWSSLLTLVLLVSLWPNQIVKKSATSEDLPKVRRDLVIMSLVSIVVLAIRAFEFGTLNVRWDQNAYGSIVWVLLGLHTAHILTDAIDTFVLTALMFTRHVNGKRFSDVEDNAFYWDFVVLSWLPIYGLIYWVSRL